MSKQILSVPVLRAFVISGIRAALASLLPLVLLPTHARSDGAIPSPPPSESPRATVVSYEPGVGAAPPFTQPEAALGPPSTTNPFGEFTDPFNPPYGTNQIVSIGAGGHLTVTFQTPILNHPEHPAGLDFTIFGNTGFTITNEFDLTTFDWVGIPATDGSLFGFNPGESLVSVSCDGREFFVLDPARSPRLDNFPPTDGAGDPGVPVAPGLGAADFAGATLADLRALYQGSAGGASFDLAAALDARGRPMVLPAIRFIRIDVLSGRLEIDAITAVNPAGITDSFNSDPLARGWRLAGDPSVARWSAVEGALDVTWDSAKSNSFCYLPLGTVLTKADDFQLTFALRLRDIRIGSTPGKPAEFPIAIGLINRQLITNSSAYRGAGVSSVSGVKNIVEWNFFPDGGFGDTWATTVVSSNNVFAFAHAFPVALNVGDVHRVTLTYTASNQVLRTTALRNGVPLATFEPITLANTPDFRVDAFSITSYSDAVQSGPPTFHGSVQAHGFLDEVILSLPGPPAGPLTLQRSDGRWAASFLAAPNWVHRLERSQDLLVWQPASAVVPGPGATLVLRDTNAPTAAAFYRIRSERP